VIAHQQQHEHRDADAGQEHRDHRVAPAEVLDQPGGEREKQQLAGGRAAGEQADYEPAPGGEPAVRDHRAEHQRGQPGAAAEHETPQHEELPQLGHAGRQHHGGRDEGRGSHHHAAQAEAGDEDRRERPEQAEQGKAHREHRRELVGAPAELAAERLQHRTGQAERRRCRQHGEEGDRGDDPAVVDAATLEELGDE
jgi:hypothetical protein